MTKRHADLRARSGAYRASPRLDERRRHIAFEAARLISEQGLRDYAVATRKAARRLGVDDPAALPEHSEIEAALREHQRLFHRDEQPRQLRALRTAAMQAMRFFARFEPRLVGAVLDGTADCHSAVCLHLFSDDADAPARFLDEQGIACVRQTRRLRLSAQSSRDFPVLSFVAGEVPFDLTVFDRDGLRQAPLERIGHAPMQRATLAMVELLLVEDDGADSNSAS